VFIQMVQGPCSRQVEMRMLVDRWCTRMADRPGWLGGTYGFTDDDRFMGIVRYDSEAACRDYGAEPDAGLWWAEAMELMDGDCEVHQSGDVTMMLDGGSDDAGFVQVMRGHVGNADLLRKMTGGTDMTNMLHAARPEIIGSTLAIEEDGSFIETVAFTDEMAARRGEQIQMPEEITQDRAEAIADVEFIDLHHPWFATHLHE
jgi:hypothetical protein